ncbi:hypothetical protein D6T65_15755 [Arthrobacter frigidicola]|nr:hypothetical protein D6T65_15755 [Arthrobacter frigidicola]
MKFWQLARTLPQPLKTILMLWVVAFAAVFLGFITLVLSGSEDLALSVIPWMFGGLGVVGFLLGLVLLTDFRGSAQAYADMTKRYKPFGVDYSRSLFSRPGLLRFFGAAYMLIGVWFVVVSTFFAADAAG